METFSLAGHVTGPWALVLTAAFFLMQALSLLLFAVNVFEYRKVVWKHRVLPDSITHSLEKEPEKGTTALLFLYVAMTAAVTAGTVLLFLFQPHLY